MSKVTKSVGKIVRSAPFKPNSPMKQFIQANNSATRHMSNINDVMSKVVKKKKKKVPFDMMYDMGRRTTTDRPMMRPSRSLRDL